MPNVVTFDIETNHLASEVGGWAALKRGEGGISCLVAWSSASGRPLIFDENTLEDAGHLLESADVILSFNGVGFDIPVLEGVLGRKLCIKQHLDLLQMVWQALPRHAGRHKGYRLTELSHRCLGIEKTGDGLMAPTLREQGRWGELFDYCLHDVYLTRRLFQFVQDHNGVIATDGSILALDFPKWFKAMQV